MPLHRFSADASLVDEINACIASGESCDKPLATDQRVLARITEGIYRQPASALRELIANAYDADATVVSIATDAPRFNVISVSDDGIGMTPEALANLVLHIGGSAKRTQRAPKLGLSSPSDPTRSEGGRKFIGKIGIGLFSVAQLTRQFVIITKTAGTDYQLLAHVTLNYPDEIAELAKVDAEGGHQFRAGEVRIWAEKTPDTMGHGTTIRLTTLLPQIVRLLQSFDIWSALSDETIAGGRASRRPPLVHIGRIDEREPVRLMVEPQLPWHPEADESERFYALVDAVGDAWRQGPLYTRLEHVLDNYFQMMWTLALSLPVEYVDKHPFGLTGADVGQSFVLPQGLSARALESLELGREETIGRKAGFEGAEDTAPNFAVAVDGVRLARPIRFSGYPASTQALQGPVVFLGGARPDLSNIPESQRGGPLAFSAYFFWAPRIVPQNHIGLLIRINGASGTLFDSTFLRYQVAERRLNQLMAEVFVEEGLEPALNIDRESFNTAHPHYQILAKWTHNSLRLIRNALKDLQARELGKRRQERKEAAKGAVASLVDELILSLTNLEPQEVADLVLAEGESQLQAAIVEGKIAYLRSELPGLDSLRARRTEEWIDSRIRAVGRLLEAHGLLENLDRSEQAALIVGIVNICSIDT